MQRKSILFCAAAIGATFLFLWQQVQATRLGYDVGRLRVSLRRQRGVTAYLRLELARLQTPGHLAEAAARRLGMRPSTPESIVFLGSTVARIRPARREPLRALRARAGPHNFRAPARRWGSAMDAARVPKRAQPRFIKIAGVGLTAR